MIGMAADYYDCYFLCFFAKLFTTSKIFLVLACLNPNPKLMITSRNQARYVSRDTRLGSLSPLGEILCFPR